MHLTWFLSTWRAWYLYKWNKAAEWAGSMYDNCHSLFKYWWIWFPCHKRLSWMKINGSESMLFICDTHHFHLDSPLCQVLDTKAATEKTNHFLSLACPTGTSTATQPCNSHINLTYYQLTVNKFLCSQSKRGLAFATGHWHLQWNSFICVIRINRLQNWTWINVF